MNEETRVELPVPEEINFSDVIDIALTQHQLLSFISDVSLICTLWIIRIVCRYPISQEQKR